MVMECLSSCPFRSKSLNDLRVSELDFPVKMSKICSSTMLSSNFFSFSSRTCFTKASEVSTRSWMILSTSRPWKPTSVNFVASTLTNGACASLASRRPISVFPTPVDPIMRMFLGETSSRRSSSNCWRLQRFLSAIATERLAEPCPTMCLSSSVTISLGVKTLTSSSFVVVSEEGSSGELSVTLISSSSLPSSSGLSLSPLNLSTPLPPGKEVPLP
mmetsp:Transcript_16110/g.29460  ORF Transcript_16110/g.29460 Transcript_16110/m.29460 type:complete len:216 (+) Transcript_16110:998-1645(+)